MAMPEVNVEKPIEVAGTFTINRKQAEQAKVWRQNHDESKHKKEYKIGQRYSGAIGGAYTWQFTETSLGEITILKCSCGDEINLTEWDNFG